MRASSSSGSLGPALLALLRRTAAASSRHQQQAGAAGAGAAAAAFSSSAPLSPPLPLPHQHRPPWASSSSPLLAGSASAAASAPWGSPPSSLLQQQQQQHHQRRPYAKKAAGGKGGKGGGAATKLSGAAVSASPDDPDAAPPPPRVRPPFVAAARRRRRALLPPVSRAARDALAALATLAPAAAAPDAADADSPSDSGAPPPAAARPHVLRDVAWPLDQRDALVLLHDATFGDTTGPGHTLLVPHVTNDLLQSAQAVASFCAECLADGVEFSLVEQYFVQTLAALGQEQAAEEAARAAEDAERAARRAAEERQRREAAAGAAEAGLSSAPTLTPPSSKTGITDMPERPFRPPRLLVRGMRIQIKGRLRGKGGKAEKKTWSWGATSAATFADPVDFAQAQAETRAGTVGVKVWLVFRDDAFDRESYALLRRRARDPATGRAVWRGPGWAADAVEELALAPRSGLSRATGSAESAVRRPLTAWWSRTPDAAELAAFAGADEGGGGGGKAAAS